MSETPRTDAAWGQGFSSINAHHLSQTLERDLAAANAEIARLKTVELPALSRCVEIRDAQLTAANAEISDYRAENELLTAELDAIAATCDQVAAEHAKVMAQLSAAQDCERAASEEVLRLRELLGKVTEDIECGATSTEIIRYIRGSLGG